MSRPAGEGAGSPPTRPTGHLVVVMVALLVVASVLAHRAGRPVSQVAVPLAAVLLLLLSRGAGLGWAELGLARPTRAAALRWAALPAAVVVAVVAIVVATPATRSLLLDERYRDDTGSALRYALLQVPLETVIPEEVAFRGALLATLGRVTSRRWAMAGSATLFGLWHLPSSLQVTGSNAVLADLLGSGPASQVASSVTVVLVTGAAGLLFALLRERSGSLLGPMALHWALNGAGVLGVAAAWSLDGG